MNYLIDFKSSAADSEIDAYFSQYNCQKLKTYDNYEKVFLVSCNSIPIVTDIVEHVVNDDETTITPLGEIIPIYRYFGIPDPSNPTVVVSTSDEKDWWKNYTLDIPEFEKPTIDVNRKGSSTNVYIMDSGIEMTHPDLASADKELVFSVTGDFEDHAGHGTAIASIISGLTCGLSSACLKVVKIFDPGYQTRQSELLSALDAVLNHYQACENKAGVINCSWTIPKNLYIEQKMRELIRQGMYIICSAGNNGHAIENVTPASMEESITIGSYSKDLVPSDFSNYSNPSVIANTDGSVNTGQLDGWAPGEQIWVATLGGGYGYANGTSMAAAIVSCTFAYNFTNFVTENSAQAHLWKYINKGLVISRCLQRPGLLILNADEKYLDSINLIATIGNSAYSIFNTRPYYEFAIREGEVRNPTKLFGVSNLKSAELMTPLPDGFFITHFGAFGYTQFSVTSNEFDLYNIKIKLTDLDDAVTEIDIKLALVNKNYDKKEITSVDDPTLNIKLGNYYSCGNNCALYAFQGDYCADDCNYGGFSSRYCNTGDCKPQAPETPGFCVCANLPSDTFISYAGCDGCYIGAWYANGSGGLRFVQLGFSAGCCG
jgi:subtilisin family serine protease